MTKKLINKVVREIGTMLIWFLFFAFINNDFFLFDWNIWSKIFFGLILLTRIKSLIFLVRVKKETKNFIDEIIKTKKEFENEHKPDKKAD